MSWGIFDSLRIRLKYSSLESRNNSNYKNNKVYFVKNMISSATHWISLCFISAWTWYLLSDIYCIKPSSCLAFNCSVHEWNSNRCVRPLLEVQLIYIHHNHRIAFGSNVNTLQLNKFNENQHASHKYHQSMPQNGPKFNKTCFQIL